MVNSNEAIFARFFLLNKTIFKFRIKERILLKNFESHFIQTRVEWESKINRFALKIRSKILLKIKFYFRKFIQMFSRYFLSWNHISQFVEKSEILIKTNKKIIWTSFFLDILKKNWQLNFNEMEIDKKNTKGNSNKPHLVYCNFLIDPRKIKVFFFP